MAHSPPLVSVVIPTYDRPNLLERAVESVAGQTYDPIELVVIDGPSDIPAAETLEGFQQDFEVVRHERHESLRGVSAARNVGLELATGEYIAFLDDDDYWMEDKVATQVNTFSSMGGDIGLVYTGVKQIGSNGRVNAVKRPNHAGDVFDVLCYHNFIGTFSSVMIPSEVIDRIGTLDESLPAWEDWDYYLRVAREYDVAAISDVLVIRDSGEHKQTSDDYELRRDEVAPRFIEKHGTWIDAEEQFNGWRFRGAVEHYLAQSAYTTGQYSQARKHAFNAVRRYPTLRSILLLGLLGGGRFTFVPVQRIKRNVVRITNG